MPDPVANQTTADGGGGVARSLLLRLFGPAADAVGERLRHYTEYQLRNVRRIVDRADAKSRSLVEGAVVDPGAAHVLLADGSYCDDELKADYFGGLLAGSRAQQVGDQRAVAWSKIITGLSALHIRAHYLLYREWAARLRIIAVYELGLDTGRMQATMDISSGEFAKVLVAGSAADESDAMSHCVGGLVRAGLLDERFSYHGERLRVAPSVAGLELYGWAQGLPGLAPREFASRARVFGVEAALPRLRSVTFPRSPERAEPHERASRRQIQVQLQRHRSGHRNRPGS